MTTPDPSNIAGTRANRAGRRRYYIWQIAMWITILHTVLVGGFTAFAVGSLSRFHWGTLDRLFQGTSPFHERLAYFMSNWPYPVILAGFVLVPVAIIACYRASMGRRAWVWIVGYWLIGATVCMLLAGSIAISHGYIWVPGRHFHFDDKLAGSVFMCAVFVTPLPATMLAALLAIERKKRPPAMEAGA